MAHYVQFESNDGRSFLVEIEGVPDLVAKGPVSVGVADTAKEVIIPAVKKIEAVWDVAVVNVQSFLAKMRSFANETFPEPDEMELCFGIKATGEGNVAIAKAGLEASYTVKLVWKKKESTTS